MNAQHLAVYGDGSATHDGAADHPLELVPVSAPELPATGRAWDLRPGTRLGARSVARTATGTLDARNLPVLRVWFEGDDEHAAPAIFHPWQLFTEKPSKQRGARWLASECQAYARRHPEGWTLEGMRHYVLAQLDAQHAALLFVAAQREGQR